MRLILLTRPASGAVRMLDRAQSCISHVNYEGFLLLSLVVFCSCSLLLRFFKRNTSILH